MASITSEIERTTNAVTVDGITADRKYVQLSDANGSWWQPADALLAILQEMPASDVGLDEEDDMDAYAAWCAAAGKAGIFGGINVNDTMSIPTDFVEP